MNKSSHPRSASLAPVSSFTHFSWSLLQIAENGSDPSDSKARSPRVCESVGVLRQLGLSWLRNRGKTCFGIECMTNEPPPPPIAAGPRLGTGGKLVRLALIGVILAAVVASFAYFGGW